jgi:hypothetical protein
MSGAPENGQLVLEVEDELGRPAEAALHLLLSENIASLGRQYRVAAKLGAGAIGGSFPAGSYIAQLFAKGYDVVREAVRLEPGATVRRRLRLSRRSFVKPSLAQRLALYGLTPDRLSPLTVRSGERVALDCRTYPDVRHFALLYPASARELKAWIGAPDAAFAGDTPRFGALAAQPGLDALLREFIHGNSRAVRAFEPAIDARVRGIDGPSHEPQPVPIFLFGDVVVEDCGVLEIGIGSSIFFRDTLTMHPQGVVRAAGDVRADIGTCIQL